MKVVNDVNNAIANLQLFVFFQFPFFESFDLSSKESQKESRARLYSLVYFDDQ